MRDPIPAQHARVPIAAAAAVLAAACCGCAGQSAAPPRVPTATAVHAHTTSSANSAAGAPAPAAAKPAAPVRPRSRVPLVTVPARVSATWQPVASIAGQPVAWIAVASGVTLLRFDQASLRLVLHAGATELGGGYPHGPKIEGGEVHRVLAGFNGGFKFANGPGGFMAGGHVGAAIVTGLGSIVTYRSGATQIGAWHAGVPARGVPVASVRQNLHLLVDHGRAAANVDACALQCWGSTLGGGVRVPRSALGIDARGRLVWAAGPSLSPATLASVLVAAGAQRAVELDINPFWVAGYLYEHRSDGPRAIPVMPGQHGIAGSLLSADNRDFFTVVAR